MEGASKDDLDQYVAEPAAIEPEFPEGPGNLSIPATS
jgi:hypothetical protein